MKKQINDKINKDIDFQSFEDDLGTLEVSNKDIMYQQNNATNRILEAIHSSEGNIQESIKNQGKLSEKTRQDDIMNNDNKKVSINDLATKYEILDNNISNTNKILAIIGTVIGILISMFGIALTIFIFTVNAQYSSINDSVNSKFDSIKTEIKSINQRLDYQEKLNTLEIQKDVAIEVKNQKISK